MTSEVEPEEFTWQSLYEYIERRIAGALKALKLFKEDPRFTDVDEIHYTSFERELQMLRQCLTLVIELQGRKSLQGISPILSLNIIRLRCREQSDESDGFVEFAWISPIAEGKYSLRQLGINASEEIDELNPIEADLIQIVEQVEERVKELCLGKNQ